MLRTTHRAGQAGRGTVRWRAPGGGADPTQTKEIRQLSLAKIRSAPRMARRVRRRGRRAVRAPLTTGRGAGMLPSMWMVHGWCADGKASVAGDTAHGIRVGKDHDQSSVPRSWAN